MKKHVIAKTIRNIYIAKLIPALLFIIFTVFIFIKYPFQEIIFPNHLDSLNSIFDENNSDQEYLQVSIPKLYYTGYDYAKNSVKKGSYYYTFIDDKCVFFLLSNETSNQTASELNNITIKSKLISDVKQQDFLTTNFSSDLSWTDTDLNKLTSNFIVSELDYSVLNAYALFIIISIVDLITIVFILIYFTFIIAPQLSPICKHFGNGKSRREALMEADLELNNNRYFYVSDMSITSNYFIELGKYHAEIIPLNKIIWAYKHSKLSKFGGISYTLIIYSNNSVSKFSHKQKYDVDFILEYLEENYSNIIIGNSKENIKNRKMNRN